MGIDDADAVDGAADSPVQRARTMHVATSLFRLGELRATVRGDAVCIDFEGALSWVLGQRRDGMLGMRVTAEAGSAEHPPNVGPLGAASGPLGAFCEAGANTGPAASPRRARGTSSTLPGCARGQQN